MGGRPTRSDDQRIPHNGPPPLRGGPLRYPPAIQKRWRRIPRRSRQTLQTDVAARRSGDTAKSNRHPQGVKNRGEQKYPLPTTLQGKTQLQAASPQLCPKPFKKISKISETPVFYGSRGGWGPQDGSSFFLHTECNYMFVISFV